MIDLSLNILKATLQRWTQSPTSLLGIDISPHKITLIEMSFKRGQYCLESYASDNISSDDCAMTLRILLERCGSHCDSVAIALSDPLLMIRRIPLAEKLGLEDINREIELIFDQVIPFSFEDSYYDFLLESSLDSTEGQSRGAGNRVGAQKEILLAACPRKKVGDWESAIASLGLKLLIVTPASLTVESSMHLEKMIFSDKISAEARENIQATISSLMPVFGLLFGALNCQQGVETSQKINLLPWREALRKTNNKKFFLWAGFSMFLALSLSLGIQGYLHYQKMQAEAKMVYLLQIKQSVDEKIQMAEILRKNMINLRRRIKIIQTLENDRFHGLRLFDSLPKIIPEGICLHTLSGKDEKISLEGNARTHSSVATLLKTLSEHSGYCSFKDVKLTEISIDKQEPGYKFNVQFALQLDNK